MDMVMPSYSSLGKNGVMWVVRQNISTSNTISPPRTARPPRVAIGSHQRAHQQHRRAAPHPRHGANAVERRLRHQAARTLCAVGGDRGERPRNHSRKHGVSRGGGDVGCGGYRRHDARARRGLFEREGRAHPREPVVEVDERGGRDPPKVQCDRPPHESVGEWAAGHRAQCAVRHGQTSARGGEQAGRHPQKAWPADARAEGGAPSRLRAEGRNPAGRDCRADRPRGRHVGEVEHHQPLAREDWAPNGKRPAARCEQVGGGRACLLRGHGAAAVVPARHHHREVIGDPGRGHGHLPSLRQRKRFGRRGCRSGDVPKALQQRRCRRGDGGGKGDVGVSYSQKRWHHGPGNHVRRKLEGEPRLVALWLTAAGRPSRAAAQAPETRSGARQPR
mmetsp:Transcript_280/g.855  ORF Transcript_280/g.855 Transcript_280/m.855 type:complete len:390 (-) Transcript_280:92-1261(-)